MLKNNPHFVFIHFTDEDRYMADDTSIEFSNDISKSLGTSTFFDKGHGRTNIHASMILSNVI